jgi:hypothetical protein
MNKNSDILLFEQITRMKTIIGLPINEKKILQTDEILNLIYEADYIGINRGDLKILEESLNIDDIYNAKMKNNKNSAFIRKFGSLENYIKHVENVVSKSTTLKKIFNDSDKVYDETLLVGARIVVDNNLIKKRAAELRVSLSDEKFVKQHCSKEVALDNARLKFSGSNAKITHHYFSLPAGITCPAAGTCLSLYDPELDILMIGSDNEGRICYAASAESQYTNVRDLLYTNYYVISKHLKEGPESLSEFITKSIEDNPTQIDVMRIHEDGDFYGMDYFMAWVLTAEKNPKIHFYFYTKYLSLLYQYFKKYDDLPKNMSAVMSEGYDKSQEKFIPFLREKGFKMAKIFDTYDDAESAGLDVDRTDALAMDPEYKKDFALVYHGTGLKGTKYLDLAKKNAKDPRTEKTKADIEDYKKRKIKTLYNLYN